MLPLLLACVSGEGDEKQPACAREELSLEEVDPPVSADEVWELLEALSPSSVEWQVTANEASSAVLLSLHERDGESYVAHYSSSAGYDCPADALFVPVLVDVDIAESSVVATSEAGGVEASGADLAAVRVYGMDSYGAAPELSEVWTADAEAVAGSPVSGWWLDLSGSLPELEIVVGGSWSTADTETSGAVWLGVAEF